MPGFDGTGPDFSGPMTGGARGYCIGARPTAGAFDGGGLGYGRGFGKGRGRRPRLGMGVGRFGNGPVTMAISPARGQADLQQLERQAEAMQRHLEALNQRIESLKTKPTE